MSTPRDSKLAMENLQPLEAYVDGMSALWTRQGRLVGIAFGAVMAVVTVLTGPSNVDRGVLAGGLLTFVGGGLLFGLVWSRRMARRMRVMTEALYAGRSPFAVDTPPGSYGYRLPASLRTSDRFAVGGVLFLGRAVMTFVPHQRNLPSYRDPVILPVDQDFAVDLVAQRSTLVRRALFGSLPALVRVTSRGASWLFLVPRPEDTAQRIRKVVAG